MPTKKRIKYSKKFLKRLSKLPQRIIDLAAQKEELFKENSFHSLLKTHKLFGEEKEVWAFWINYSYRIKFIFIDDNFILFLDIGTHDIYK